MDMFYLRLPIARKLRVHFHEFMRHLHDDMKAVANGEPLDSPLAHKGDGQGQSPSAPPAHEEVMQGQTRAAASSPPMADASVKTRVTRGEDDPLKLVCERLSMRYDLICFDEFHVSDIADAMLLGRMLRLMVGAGTRLVMTSNYAPAALYPNGLARDRFLPAIALLEGEMLVFDFGEQPDYRRKYLAQRAAYFSPADRAAAAQMTAIFDGLARGIEIGDSVKLSGRAVSVVRRGPDCVWFDFATLCESARGQADYLQLARRFATVLLSGVPRLDGAARREAARRFTWLVDILYDARVKLVMSADAPLERLYGDGGDGGESGRTLSRLYEIFSPDWGRA